MTRAFAFNEPQPVFLDDDRGLSVVGVYPSGHGYAVVDAFTDDGQQWLVLQLPCTEDPVESEFPEWAGKFVDTADGGLPEIIGFLEAAARFPGLIPPEEVENFRQVERSFEEWQAMTDRPGR